jgi:cytochrome b
MQTTIKVWDLPLRLFHWLLVIAFFLAYVTEDDFLTIHVWAGYLVIGLLLFRLIWGFMGNEYARFSQFLCTPSAGFTYLKQALAKNSKRYLGHNPAGAVMIVLLLGSIFATTLTGLLVYAADQNAGLFAGMVSTENEELWEETHEFFANFSVLLVLVHIAGVIFESRLHQENLARAMVTGEKRAENTQTDHQQQDEDLV